MLDAKSDLNQLLIFVKVVDARSFTAAGRTLGLPKSTVSRKIAQLEERLGAQLLRRTTRKLELTEVGAAFYERCSRIARQVEDVETSIAKMDEAPRGLLRVAAPPELGSLCLAVLAELLREHGRLRVELELSGRMMDLQDDGFDLALRLESSRSDPGWRSDRGLQSVALGSSQRRLVASPRYLERRGLAKLPSELERHDLVTLPDTRIELCGPGRELVEITARPRLVVDDHAMLREAALAGIGIAMLPLADCKAELESGRLRGILPAWVPAAPQVFAEYPKQMHLDAKLRLFVEALRHRLEGQPPVPVSVPEVSVPEVSVPDSPVPDSLPVSVAGAV